jgi:predicted dinucleotide-binding enzyme
VKSHSEDVFLGAGNVGGTLGRAWARKGRDVFFGVPSPEDAKTRELLATTLPLRRVWRPCCVIWTSIRSMPVR